jgi:L-amino acid N-acyltransferase YncA
MDSIFSVKRRLHALFRPTPEVNRKRLAERGESLDRFVIREARRDDASVLARVHVTTWNATHGGLLGRGPSYELRHGQWQTKLGTAPNRWFCYLAENPSGQVVGFATGQEYAEEESAFDARLEKIYLLADYQRVGLGRSLFTEVVRRHVREGRRAMLLFSQADNPSCAFFEALGGERLLAPTGAFHGGYGWRDLPALEARLERR